MIANQDELNARYQAVLSKVFGGTITVEGKFLNEKAVLLHRCSECNSTFWAKPLWLTSRKQLHKCYASEVDATKVKRVRPKKATSTKKRNSAPNKVTEEMRREMVTLYKDGNSLKGIGRQFEVTSPTVKKHLIKSGIKLNA